MPRTSAVITVLALLIVCAISSGCGSTGLYGKYYKPNETKQFEPTEKVELCDFSEETLLRLINDGHFVVGESNFNSSLGLKSEVIRQAKMVGADIVLLSHKYTHGTNSLVPVTTYYGNDPYTSFVPYTTDFYDQRAVFLRKKTRTHD